jgi:hypothetical protein
MHRSACDRNGNAPVCGGKMFSNDAHIIYYQKKAMYRHVQAACGRNGNAPVSGEKMFSNDAHIIYYQKRQCTDMDKQLV